MTCQIEIQENIRRGRRRNCRRTGRETFLTIKGEMKLDNVLGMMNFIKNFDFIILEGFKNSKYAKISTSDFKDDFTIANVKVFEMDDSSLKTLVDLLDERSYGMIKYLNCKKCGFDSCDDFVDGKIKGNRNATLCKSESDEVLLKNRQPNDTIKSIREKFC